MTKWWQFIIYKEVLSNQLSTSMQGATFSINFLSYFNQCNINKDMLGLSCAKIELPFRGEDVINILYSPGGWYDVLATGICSKYELIYPPPLPSSVYDILILHPSILLLNLTIFFQNSQPIVWKMTTILDIVWNFKVFWISKFSNETVNWKINSGNKCHSGIQC